MESYRLEGQARRKKCVISISENEFIIEGNYYYLINKEFIPKNKGRDSCLIEEYLGLGNMKKDLLVNSFNL